jgi:hypothetical protein
MATRLLETTPLPERMRKLPRTPVGYPIPWFVATLPDGTRDFRVADATKQVLAGVDRLCWVCGERTGGYVAFTIGPMCAVNRLSSEPPSHRECAIYSATVCPFLSNPCMRRRPTGEFEGKLPTAGEMITRNPGVALVWVTRGYSIFRPPKGMGQDGYLYGPGEPTDTLWFAEGRPATRGEVLASIETGLPALREACDRDDDPPASRADLDREVARAVALAPRE